MTATARKQERCLTPEDLGHPEMHPAMAQLHDDVVRAAKELLSGTAEERPPRIASFTASTPERMDRDADAFRVGLTVRTEHPVQNEYRLTDVWSSDEERLVRVKSELAEPYVLHRLGWEGNEQPTWWFGLRMELRDAVVLDVCWGVDSASVIGWFYVESTTPVGAGFVKDAAILTKNPHLVDLAERMDRASFDADGYVNENDVVR
jgi:hypothetical protein